MSGNSYASKLLRATLTLPAGTFPGTGSNTLTLVGYRTLASITGASGYPNALDLTVFGMRQADMNAVTILWSAATPTAAYERALIQLEASSDGGQSWSQVFSGTFTQAQPDYRNPPYVGLRAQAFTGNGMQIGIAPPISYPGSATVLSVAQALADAMDFTLENNGVTGNLSTPYFSGSYMDQFKQLCQHANLDFYFDGNGTLAICPYGQPRQGKPVPVLTPTTGLRGWPTIGQYGIHVDALFLPSFVLGGQIKIQDSEVPGANGTWSPYNTTLTLESLQPDGAWFAAMDCRYGA